MSIVEDLLRSEEPVIQFKARVGVLKEDPEAAGLVRLRQRIRGSKRVEELLGSRPPGSPPARHPYSKWRGAHWVLSSLADLGYPAGDESLIPWREQVYQWLLPDGEPRRMPRIAGRVRRCGSQAGNAVYYLLTLGLADRRTDILLRGLMEWQWPDGGWNCDVRRRTRKSSFHESLLPLRALALYARLKKSSKARTAAKRAAEIFLKRRTFRRQSDGEVMKKDFLRLRYPPYWHYDILCGLKVISEAGLIGDERCREALDLLESKRLPDGGWAAQGSHYRRSASQKIPEDRVSWGDVGRGRVNEFVTVDALSILMAAGRLP